MPTPSIQRSCFLMAATYSLNVVGCSPSESTAGIFCQCGSNFFGWLVMYAASCPRSVLDMDSNREGLKVSSIVFFRAVTA